jgi:hypothetical protein
MADTILGATQALDQSVNTIISEFRLLQDEKPVMQRVARRVPLGRNKGPSVYIDNYSRVTAYDVPDAADVANAQALADAQTTGTPSEVAAQVILAGRTVRQTADTSIMANTAKILNRAIQLKMEQDATAQLPSFTGIVGAAGTVISPGHAAAAVSRVQIGNDRTNPEPYDDINMVLHPYHMLVLGGRIVPYTDVPTGTNAYGVNTGAHLGVTVGLGSSSGSLSDEIMRKGPRAIAQLQGVPIWLTANIAVDSSDDGSGAVFDRTGLNFCPEVEPDIVEDRDPSLRGAVELTAWASYDWFLYRSGNSGIEMLFDASTPTS